MCQLDTPVFVSVVSSHAHTYSSFCSRLKCDRNKWKQTVKVDFKKTTNKQNECEQRSRMKQNRQRRHDEVFGGCFYAFCCV